LNEREESKAKKDAGARRVGSAAHERSHTHTGEGGEGERRATTSADVTDRRNMKCQSSYNDDIRLRI